MEKKKLARILGVLGLGVLAVGCGATPPSPPHAPVAKTSVPDGREGATAEHGPARQAASDRLTRDLKAAQGRWDWAGTFALLDGADDVDPDERAVLRTRTTIAWERFVDDTLARIVEERSVKRALGDRREAFLAALDKGRMPTDVTVEIERRARRLTAVMLVFDVMEDGAVLEPSKPGWAFGAAPTRTLARPDLAGAPLARNHAFVAVARGRVDGVELLAMGSGEGDALARLESISGLVVASSTRAYDTTALLPPDLQKGDRVLAPLAGWPSQLCLHEVLAVGEAGLSVKPVVAGAARWAPRSELRAAYVPAGTAVLVPVAGSFKHGAAAEIIDGPEAKVTVDGATRAVPFEGVRVEVKALPPVANGG